MLFSFGEIIGQTITLFLTGSGKRNFKKIKHSLYCSKRLNSHFIHRQYNKIVSNVQSNNTTHPGTAQGLIVYMLIGPDFSVLFIYLLYNSLYNNIHN